MHSITRAGAPPFLHLLVSMHLASTTTLHRANGGIVMATIHQRHRSLVASLLLIGVLCLTGIVHVPAAVAASATLVQTINTGAGGSWGPLYSPDPAGITYWPAKNRLVIVDSEVDEMTIWAGANVFESSLTGV